MRQTNLDVCAIGNAIVDVLAQVDDSFLLSRDMHKGSMRLIEEIEAHRIYDAMGPAIETSGGSAANTASGLAMLGGKTGFIGRIHQDELGEVFAHDIRASGVMFKNVPTSSGPATGRCYVLVTPDGERTMNTFLGAASNFDLSDIDVNLIKTASITYLEGYLWDKSAAKSAFLTSCRIAKAQSRKVALTLSDKFCVERHRDSFIELIRDEIDILFSNEAEICSLYKTNDISSAIMEARKSCPLVIITRSKMGSIVLAADESIHVPSYKVSKVIDTTGAGDLYAAGFLYGFSQGFKIQRCAELGSFVAAEIIGQIGARAQSSLREKAESAGIL